MLTIFNIPNLFTASNMLCGISSILLSLTGRIDLAPYPIFLGAIFDFLDGFLARLLKQQSELGKQLDSLADMITFGLAPGMMMMVLLTYVVQPTLLSEILMSPLLADTSFVLQVKIGFYSWIDQVMKFENFSWIPFIALLIPFMSMFRLAKFNIDTRQSESFIGLNTPANTIFFTSFPLLLVSAYNQGNILNAFIFKVIQPEIIIPLILLMSFLLISEIPFFSFKFKSFKWKGNELRFSFLITCLILIPVLLVWSIPIIVLLYIVLSIIENIFFKKKQHEIQS